MKKKKPLIGISACLLGENVRYNGGHTNDSWISNELKEYIDFYPICPEVEMGLGVPREEIYLSYNKEDMNKTFYLKGRTSKNDYTSLALSTYQKLGTKLEENTFDGFILMKKSPSCGLKHVKAIDADDKSKIRMTKGLFANFISEKYPDLPKIDSGRIQNKELREHFIKNIFAHYHFDHIQKEVFDIQMFHKKYKYILMEHSQTSLKKLGKIVANSDKQTKEKVFSKYKQLFFETLGKEATKNNRINTFLHIMGYLKKYLTSNDKKQLLGMFDDYKKGAVNYLTVKTLLNFFINKYDIEYLKDHYYFEPYPKELKLGLAI